MLPILILYVTFKHTYFYDFNHHPQLYFRSSKKIDKLILLVSLSYFINVHIQILTSLSLSLLGYYNQLNLYIYNNKQIMQINHNVDQKVVAQKRHAIMLGQVKAILINNILINIRRFLFLKEMAMIVFILTLCIASIQISSFDFIYLIFFYSILAMIFISRSELTLLNDNRQKYTYFLKAYGMNSFIYIMSWVMYTLVLGMLKYAIYIILIYSYLKIRQQKVEQQFSGLSDLETTNIIGIYCFLNLLAYLSTYSYSLFAVTILSKNQIGLKLLSPILFVGLFELFSQQPNSQINFYISPTGWLVYTISEQIAPQFYYLIFCGHFFLPLITSICIQLVKINRIQLIKTIKKIIKKDIIPVEQFQFVQIKQLKKKSLIKLTNLTKKYGKKIVLNQINATIYQGEIIMLYGKNGSGKTTLINILSNLQYFSDGTMHTAKTLKLGVSLQNNYFQNELTVKENILFYAQLKGVVIDNEQSLMDRFQLTDFCQKEYYKISGGNRKKMSLACAFLGNNDLIILDEPTMGIDSVVQQQIQKIMIKQKRRNQTLTMIISTCQIGISFLQIANRIWILNKNQLILNQTIQNIKNLSQNFVIINFNKLQKQKILQFLAKIKLIQGIQILTCQQTFKLQFSLRFFKIIVKFIDQCQLKNNISISISNVSDKISKLIQAKQNVQNRRVKILNFKQNYQSSHHNKTSFFSLFYASLIICLYQIIPSFIDILYFCGILFYFLGLILVNDNLQNCYTSFFIFYPLLSPFIYSHIYVSYLQNRESKYQTIIFQMGMKKTAYWLAHYIVNILIITLPLIIVLYLQLQNDLGIHILVTFLFNILLISFSYLVSLFFKINHIYKNFLPIIVSIVYLILFSTLNQHIIIIYFLSFLICMLTFVVLFFLINHILFKRKNRSRKIMSQSKGIQLLIENAIDQKINVAAIVQEKSEIFYNSLIIQNIYRKYSENKFGIKGLNMVISQGTVFGLLGMNGSGKSTTIKMILNEIFKTYGNVYFQGKEIIDQTSDIYNHISVSPQENYLNCNMSIYSHLKIFCLIKGIEQKLQLNFIISLLTLFDMNDQIYENIKNISGGTKMKLKFITALLGKSKFIFLDEPNIGVDEESQDNLRQIVQYFSQKHKMTTIIISHRIDYIRKLCKKVAIIKRGSLLFIDQKNNLVRQYSRGYEVKLLNPSYQEFSDYLIEVMDEMFKVYQISKIYDGNILKISIPYQRIKSAMDIIKMAAQLYEKGYVGGFEIKEEDLQQVYKYIVFRNDQNFRQIIDQFLKMKAQNIKNKQI